MRGGISTYWFRNFKTGDAPGFDIELDADQIGVGRETFAYLWNWNSDRDYGSKAPWQECLNSQSTASYNTIPITEAAWQKVYVEPIVHEIDTDNHSEEEW